MRFFLGLAFLLVLGACGTNPPVLNAPAGAWSNQTFDYQTAATLAAERPQFTITTGELLSQGVWTTVSVGGDTCFHLPKLRNGYRVTACAPGKDSWYGDSLSYSRNVLTCNYMPAEYGGRTFLLPYYPCW